MKKTLSVFFVLLLLLSIAPLGAMSDVLLNLDFDFGVTAHATGDMPYLTSGFCGDTSDGGDGTNIAWSLDADGTLTLTGTGKMGSTPNREDNRVKKLVVGEGITELADYGFAYCQYLEEITLPSSLVTTGNHTFYNDTALTSVDLGEVQNIGKSAFTLCRGITSVEIPDTVEFIGQDAFNYCNQLKSVHLGNSIKSIGIYAFHGCQNLTGTIVFPDACTTVGENAFMETKITSFAIGAEMSSFQPSLYMDYLTSIDVSADNEVYTSYDGVLYTKDFSKLVQVPAKGILNIPAAFPLQTYNTGYPNYEALPFNFLKGWSGINYVNVDEANEAYCSIDGIVYSKDGSQCIGCPQAFQGSAAIAEGTKRIVDDAFCLCRSITSVEIPDTVEFIGQGAFDYCNQLKSVHLGNGIKSIGKNAFHGCQNLTGTIVFPDVCTTVGENAFMETKITSFAIGAEMSSFQPSLYMDYLTSIDVSADNEVYASYDGVLYTKDFSKLVQVPAKGILNIPAAFPLQTQSTGYPTYENVPFNFLKGWSGVYCVNIDEANAAYCSKDGIVYSKDGTQCIACPLALAGSVAISDGTQVIGNDAFSLCRRITSVEIPDTVEFIGQDAFNYCNQLKSVHLGNSIKSIGKDAFHGCQNLTAFNLPFVLQKWDLSNDQYTKLSTVTIPNRYTELANYGGVTAPIGGEVYAYCGSSGHEFAVKRLYHFNSLGHAYLDWYTAEPATFDHDGLEKRDCAYCGESETRVIPKLEQETFTATFVADGKVVASVDFQKGTTVIDEPAVPARDRYTGRWEDYTLNDADLTINAVYTLIKSDDAQEIETDSTIEHYTEKDNVLFRVKATSAAKIVKSVVSQSIPLDIVLVVDQSGSMEDTLGGSTKKVDALKAAANSFIDAVADNARLTGAAHHIAIAGFGLAGTYSGYQPYENTELLTGANGVVNYLNVTPADYASALLPVLNGNATNAALTDAVAAIEARGATAADLGLEMAKGIFANTDSTGRERVVIFMTDGEPTYQSGFQKEVANNAVYNAGLIKNAYDALIYSVGIFDQSQSGNRKIQSFMNAVSSNYPNAKTYTALGAAASDLFSITAEHTDALNDVFHTITTESLSHTAPFDNVTLIKTLSPYVTLTAPQEETLRVNVMRQYGILNDQITITRDDQGRTQIRIDGLTPYEVTDDAGNVSYEVAIEFFASLNEKAAAAGTYAVDTDDSGIMLGEDAVGYEGVFSTNELTLSAQKTRYIFTINGEVYEIAEGSAVASAVPETDFAADWQFSGWNTTGVSNANGTIIDATLVKAPRTVTWHTADGDTTQVYTQGEFLTPPEVPDRADGSKFLSWDKSLPTVMLDQDLEFTAVYGPHIHRYVSALTKKATCTEDGILTYTCICGDSYTEPVDASGHNYEAITAAGDSDPTRCTFVCTNCGDKYDYALNYKVEERSFFGSRTVYEFALTDDNLETGMQPDGSIDVRVPLNEFQSTATRVKVQRYVNGRWEAVPAVIEDGFLVITADHFTPYEVQFTFSCNETGTHTWDEGRETKAATCTEEGEMTYTCETCEGTKTEPISKKDHTPGEWVVDKEATCKEAGSKHQECAVCHETIDTDTIPVDFLAHSLTHVDSKAATTEAEGNVEYYHCTVCGKNFSDANGTTELAKVSIDKLIPQKDPNACKYCGEVHKGPFGWLIKIIHSILAIFKK